MSDITVVAVTKNRDWNRIKKFLTSLKEQTHPCDVVIVDYGSEYEYRNVQSVLISNFESVKYIEVKTNIDIFNKCRALNIGIKSSNTPFIFSTDIDCIFSKNFIEKVVNVLKKEKAVVLCQKIDLDKEGKKTQIHEPSASGSCIGITKDWINKVHGYDETYTYWGREDNDLVDRAVQDGHKLIWITNDVELLHQWHEPSSQQTLNENDMYYKIANKPIIRNPDFWGEL